MWALLLGIALTGVVPVVIAADEDPASLDRLADIVIPPPVAWWPLAPAWYGVTGAILLVVVAFTIALWRRRRCNAYRAAALAELNRVGREPSALPRIAEILKRTALAAAPREDLAALSGERWVHWLNQTGNGVIFAEKSGQMLSEHLYAGGQPDKAEIDALAQTARAWIRKHKTAEAMPAADPHGDRNG